MVAKPRMLIDDITPEELDALYDIEVHSYNNPWPRDAFKRELKLPFSRILVARNNDPFGARGPERPIARFALDGAPPPTPFTPLFGYLVLWIIRGEAHVLNLAVHPDHRRIGVATSLLESGINAARLQGAEILYLEVRRSNAGAQKLYEDFGFKVVGVRPRYYEDNREDALVMLLELKAKT